MLIIGPDPFLRQSSPGHSPQPRSSFPFYKKSNAILSLLLSGRDTVYHHWNTTVAQTTKRKRMMEKQLPYSQLPGTVFNPTNIWKKTIPTTFIPFSIWYGYLCSPHKILGCIYESSREHVFHKGSPFRFISISFIQRGDPYEKQVLWKIHKHPLIFCMVDISNHSKLKMQ